MKKLTYFGVFEPGADGSYGVSFPDLPGCITVGKNFDDAMKMAADALNLHVYGMKQDGDNLPVSSRPPFADVDSSCIVAPVTIFPSVFKTQMDTKAVKTNCTLPAWLKELGEQKHVNYSQLLQTALMEYLDIDQSEHFQQQ